MLEILLNEREVKHFLTILEVYSGKEYQEVAKTMFEGLKQFYDWSIQNMKTEKTNGKTTITLDDSELKALKVILTYYAQEDSPYLKHQRFAQMIIDKLDLTH